MAEDGRPSQRGHCLGAVLLLPLLIPYVLLRLLLMHLQPTPGRRKLIQLIDQGMVRKNPHSHEIRYEHSESRLNLTARVAQLIRARWVDKELNVLDEGRQHLPSEQQ